MFDVFVSFALCTKEKVFIKEEPVDDFENSCSQDAKAVDPLGSFVDIKTEVEDNDENSGNDILNEERDAGSETNNTNNLDPLATGDNFRLRVGDVYFI